ncbi:MAG TPA: DUF1203 domain-containing protein [Telluria sp.]|nr:DUF1203 domain-containing protein [Telluria sp.]
MYRIIPLPAAYIERVRGGLDDLGQPVEQHTATGGEPLRDGLRRAAPGEAILLASYTPFAGAHPYKEYGPVFVSAAGPGPERLDRLPTEGELPYLGQMFVLRAYSAAERIVDAVLSSPAEAEGHLAGFFARPEVAFVLARFPTYGCYGLRLERN